MNVATAPSPATSGTSLSVGTGEGADFITTPFYAIVWPTAVDPSPSNSETIRVTNITGDVLTIVRAELGSTARTIIVGDQIAIRPLVVRVADRSRQRYTVTQSPRNRYEVTE